MRIGISELIFKDYYDSAQMIKILGVIIKVENPLRIRPRISDCIDQVCIKKANLHHIWYRYRP